MSNTIGFRNRNDEVRTYAWNGETIEVSNGEVINQSANALRAKTAKGRESLQVTELTKKNWEKAARVHADRDGFFKTASEREITLLPKEGEGNKEPRLKIVQDWLEAERGAFK